MTEFSFFARTGPLTDILLHKWPTTSRKCQQTSFLYPLGENMPRRKSPNKSTLKLCLFLLFSFYGYQFFFAAYTCSCAVLPLATILYLGGEEELISGSLTLPRASKMSCV